MTTRDPHFDYSMGRVPGGNGGITSSMRVQRTKPEPRLFHVYEEVGVSDRETDRYTVYCVMPDADEGDPGAYDEEIRVAARDAEHALEVAAAAIYVDFDDRLVPRSAEKSA